MKSFFALAILAVLSYSADAFTATKPVTGLAVKKATTSTELNYGYVMDGAIGGMDTYHNYRRPYRNYNMDYDYDYGGIRRGTFSILLLLLLLIGRELQYNSCLAK